MRNRVQNVVPYVLFLSLFPSFFQSPCAFAQIPAVSRRAFIRTAGVCVAALLARSDPAFSPVNPARRQWAMPPNLDLDTLGLESFGESVGELLAENRYVTDPSAVERIRWNLQGQIWDRIAPRAPLGRPVDIELVVAFPLASDRYLYLEPHFRLMPLTAPPSPGDGRTLSKVIYRSDLPDPRVLTYWFGPRPHDPDTIVF